MIHVALVLHWTARALSGVLLVLIAALILGEGPPNPMQMSLPENLLAVAGLTVALGLILGWRWERVGGLLIVGGWFVFLIVNHGIRPNVVVVLVPLVGVLLFLAGWLRKRLRPRS